MNKIYIDGSALVEGHFSGIGQYVLGITRGLDKILENNLYEGHKAPEIFVIIPFDSVKKFTSYGFKHIGYKKFPVPFRYTMGLWHRGLMPPMDLIYGRGIYIFPRFVKMPLVFSKSATVIFDLTFVLYRQFTDNKNASFLSKHVGKTIQSTDKVIAISKNAREEIINHYKLQPEKVLLSTPATDQQLFYRRGSEEIDLVKEKYDITGDYILSLSNLEPRKNLEALINAYCSLPKDITDNVALLLVGVSGWKTDELFSKILDKVKEGYNIIRPSKYVSDLDKPAIISGAKMLVYPSHYEGFGMPPLEALACGTPVICANNSSLPEVVGQAGTLVDIDDEQALVKVMQDTLDNLSEVTKKAILSGPKQAEKYSWVDSARVFYNLAAKGTL